MKLQTALGAVLLLLASCGRNTSVPRIIDQDILFKCQAAIDECIIYDHFPPLQASRNYVYPHIAAYEVLVPFFPEYRSLQGQLNGFPVLPKQDTAGINLDAAVTAAFQKTGSALVYSRYLDSFRMKTLTALEEKIGKKAVARSVAYGERIADSVLAWAGRDRFRQTRNAPQHNPGNEAASWQPTTPDFLRGTEPHWGTLRSMLFTEKDFPGLEAPVAYDSTPGSAFMQAAREVLDVQKKLDSTQTAIAWYWDDNPVTITHFGHATINTFKLAPPGHWMGITRYAVKAKKLGLMETAEAFTRVSISAFDALIACWKEKYRWDYIRPETVIRRHMEPNYSPLIQTPPFPEFPSGHATISASNGRVLHDLFGDYTFTDSTMLQFGIAPRTFNSFIEAADEAAMSRLYGGIHFRNGNEAGKQLGTAVHALHKSKLRTRSGGG